MTQKSAECGVAPADVLSLPEFEEHARQCMTSMAYGSRDGRHARHVAWARARVPILLAPTAYHRAIHPEGELATARGAGAARATWVVSTATATPLEDIVKVASAPLWFQLYVQSAKGATQALVQRAEANGCQALCLTVATPVQGARNRQVRAKFALPPGVTAPHMTQLGTGGHAVTDTRCGVAVTWNDVEWLRSIARIPLLLKGIVTGDDAEHGIAAGASGSMVSNHGARNLDTLPATIDALPEVTERVAGRVLLRVEYRRRGRCAARRRDFARRVRDGDAAHRTSLTG